MKRAKEQESLLKYFVPGARSGKVKATVQARDDKVCVTMSFKLRVLSEAFDGSKVIKAPQDGVLVHLGKLGQLAPNMTPLRGSFLFANISSKSCT